MGECYALGNAPQIILRTSEFNWQEGHNVFATYTEAAADARKMHKVYGEYMEKHLGNFQHNGRKKQPKKDLPAQTTHTQWNILYPKMAKLCRLELHDLGTAFCKSFGIQYLGDDGGLHHAYTTSWGTTSMNGGQCYNDTAMMMVWFALKLRLIKL